MYRPVLVTALAAVLLVGGVAGCSDSDSETSSSTTRTAPLDRIFAEPYPAGTQPPTVTYDTTVVPVGAKAGLDIRTDDDSTTVKLRVEGLVPGRMYGAHVHTKPCGAKPADSGPHYQDNKDPITPSTDPAYANPRNEIWLDFTTDSQGAATAEATVDWKFRPAEANSVVIHQMQTATNPGKAGTAGDRIACTVYKF
ncbi:MAG: superoxide dismutase family protein [Mycobacteriales bacterium]